MRFINPSLLIGCMALTLVGKADAAPWTSAKFPGEQDRAVQGCADEVQNPGDWFCIFVRCEQPRSPLSLHFSAPGPDIPNRTHAPSSLDNIRLSSDVANSLSGSQY
jgi:hypothetical protein